VNVLASEKENHLTWLIQAKISSLEALIEQGITVKG